MLGALRKKEFTASFVEHFKGNHENTICNIQFEDHKHVFQTQNYSSNNMAITSPICQHNRLQNEHTLKKLVRKSNIDYILVRNNTSAKVFDPKVTILTATNSDHKPVIAKIMIKWKYQKLKAGRNVSTYMINQNIKSSYQNEIKSYLIDNHDQLSDNQNLWNKITKILKQAPESTIGYVNKSRKSINRDSKNSPYFNVVSKFRLNLA